MKILCINFKPDVSYFTKRGLNFEIDYLEDKTIFPLRFVARKQNQKKEWVDLYTPDASSYLQAKYPRYKYAIIFFGYDPKQYDARLGNTGGFTDNVLLPTTTCWGTVRLDGNENTYFTHEMHHALANIVILKFNSYGGKDYMDITPVTKNGVLDWSDFQPFYKNDQPDAPDSNHGVTWNFLRPHLPALRSIKYDSNTYKYFNEREVTQFQLEPILWQKLDEARELAGVPFIINSGKRTALHNKLVGGSPKSTHLTGLGVDLRCLGSATRFKMVKALIDVGFTRVILYANHLHVDLGDESYPQPLLSVNIID